MNKKSKKFNQQLNITNSIESKRTKRIVTNGVDIKSKHKTRANKLVNSANVTNGMDTNSVDTNIKRSVRHKGQFQPKQSGFQGRKHADFNKHSPAYWRKFYLNQETNRKVKSLKKFIDACRVFFDLPKRWCPSHVELLECMRLICAWEQEVPESNFEYLRESTERLDGRSGVHSQVERSTHQDTVILLPMRQQPEQFEIINPFDVKPIDVKPIDVKPSLPAPAPANKGNGIDDENNDK